MRKSGKYKTLTMTFGILPLVGTILLTQLQEDSSTTHKWLTIVYIFFAKFGKAFILNRVCKMPLGFGNAVVLQTMYSKLSRLVIVAIF